MTAPEDKTAQKALLVERLVEALQWAKFNLELSHQSSQEAFEKALVEVFRTPRTALRDPKVTRVIEMAKQAYAVDAVQEWFDIEGDGLKAALADLDSGTF